MPLPTLGAPALQLGDGTATSSAEEQYGASIGRCHLPELGSEALVIRVSFAAALPGQAIDLLGLGGRFDAILGLQLQIELHGLLQALAGGVVAPPGSGAAAEIGEGGGDGEEYDEGEKVWDRDVVKER